MTFLSVCLCFLNNETKTYSLLISKNKFFSCHSSFHLWSFGGGVVKKMFSSKFYSSSSLTVTFQKSTWLIIITIIFCRIRSSSTILFGGVKMVPKFLPRVVAGFYSLHPAYETDIPAPIASMAASKPKFVITSAASTFSHNKNNYQQYPGQQQQIVKYHQPPMMVKYRKPINHQNQYKKYHQIRLDPHIINNYMLLARKLAIYYGTKYQYSVDILYVC